MSRPKILITNDDGIYAPGITHLFRAIKDFADVTIVAPATEQSGVGLSISVRTPLKVQKVDIFPGILAHSVTGTPADCVKMAMTIILKTKPDIIVSGMNCGSNHGRSLLYSGTCGGVIEGIFQGIPGIAFSCYDMEETNYQTFEPYVPKIIEYILKNPLPSGTMLNVNFPSKKTIAPDHTGPHKIKLTRQGRQFWLASPENHAENSYFLGWKLAEYDESEESDAYWLDRGLITAAPVHVDELTDWRYLHAKKDDFEKLF
jgi:5'-nucleotidase